MDQLATRMSQPRLPLPADFPSSVTLSITPPPAGKLPINVLILLHGLGDTQTPFTTLGTRLQLPETCCISLCGPTPLPYFFTGSGAPSFHWGDDILFDERLGSMDLDAGFQKTTQILENTISALQEKCHFPPRNIFLFGFGQGGMAALSLATLPSLRDVELGGVISIGGKLPSSSSSSGAGKCKTPVLLCGGSRSTEITRSTVDRVKETFGQVEYVKWEKGEDSMPGNREEMLPIMRFFGRRLRSRAGVPEGAMEV